MAGAGLLIFKMILNAKSNEQMKSAFAYMQEHMSMEAAYHYNIGFYLLMLSSILLIVSGFLYLRKKA